MPQKLDNPDNVPANIRTLNELKAWLTTKSIDISQWGRGTAKTVESLWHEIVNQEVYLQDNPPLRVSSVVQVIVRKGNRILLEAEQVFDDQRRRFRDCPPSEKMRQGENYRDAALRCLNEELGVDEQSVELITSTYRQGQEETESLSYPGLRTRYILHRIEAKVAGLPATDFWTIEAARSQRDPTRKHRWVWRNQAGEIDR
jgi:ADP-ribose pyrophosphatase YjhB (NUDIX family)